jgi:hypothetical protein
MMFANGFAVGKMMMLAGVTAEANDVRRRRNGGAG